MEQEINCTVNQSEDQKSDNELIKYIKDCMYNAGNWSHVEAYWKIGTRILEFYNGECNQKNLIKISRETDIKIDNIVAACEFAKKYSEDQMKAITWNGGPLHWFQIVNNLDVDPEKLVEICENIDNYDFDATIMEYKKADKENQGQSVIKSIVKEQNLRDLKTVMPIEKAVDTTFINYPENIDQFKIELNNLKSVIAQKDEIIGDKDKEIIRLQSIMSNEDFEEEYYIGHLECIMWQIEDNVDRIELMHCIRLILE